MRKKLVSSALIATMAISMLAGCGAKKDNNDAGKGAASSDGKVFNIYCWNDEFQRRMISHYPDYQKVDATTGKIKDITVKWTIVPSDNNAYQNALDEAMLKQDKAENDKKIDLFLADADYVLKYVNSDYSLDVINDIGIKKEDLKDQYKYTMDTATDDKGTLKGLSWQASPGTMIYRRDVAKKVFGTDDPKEIQKHFKDWNTFKETGKKLKDAGYTTTSAATDTYRVFSNNVSSKWVVDGKVNIDKNIMNWVDLSKEMVDKGYTGTHDVWSADWSKGFTKSAKVFSYFGPSWFIDFTLGKHDLDGQWAATQGPQSFSWGGTWIFGATGTDNKDLVKDIMQKMTCDKKTMVDIVKDDHDFVNNVPTMKEMANDKTFSNKILGGQNPLPLYVEGAQKIDLSNISSYDEGCNEEFQKAMKNYFIGSATKEEAINLFYKNIKTKYPDVKTDDNK